MSITAQAIYALITSDYGSMEQAQLWLDQQLAQRDAKTSELLSYLAAKIPPNTPDDWNIIANVGKIRNAL